MRAVSPALAIASTLLFGSATSAAEQGAQGIVTKGTISIIASVAPRTQLAGVADVDFPQTRPGSIDVSMWSGCIWSNTATKAYAITAIGSGPGGSFTMTNGLNSIPYTVGWESRDDRTQVTPLAAGRSLSDNNAAPYSSCKDEDKISLAVGQVSSGWGTVGIYSGELTMVISPQ